MTSAWSAARITREAAPTRHEVKHMTTAVGPDSRLAASEAPRPADALVIFGITGDLARVMTFHSL